MADGTTLLTPDSDDNQKTFPQQSAQQKGLGLPIDRLVGLPSLATGSCIFGFAPYQVKAVAKHHCFLD